MVACSRALAKSVTSSTSKTTTGAVFGGAILSVRKLWKVFCLKNCHVEDLDLAAVPYIVERTDMMAIAPLWKLYTLLIKERLEVDQALKRQFGGASPAPACKVGTSCPLPL